MTTLAALAIAWPLAFPVLADEMSTSPLGSPDGPLASRLSTKETAGEYWDVTAWFDSGERFFARFLVTNQGPGERSAAAVGHFVGADGTVVPFRWGRRDGAWTLADGRRLSIGKATLDVSAPAITVRIDSKKHGIDLGLEIDGGHGVEAYRSQRPAQTFAVAMPAAARGTLNADDPSKARTLGGSAALVHRWSDQPESENVRRRDELFARRGEVALYVASTTWSDGTHHMAYDLRRASGDDSAMYPQALAVGPELLAGSEDGYPMARTWRLSVGEFDVQTTLDRALLRLNPLDVLPQPFRFLMARAGTPRRVWADATVRLVPARRGDAVELGGIALSSFARAEP